MVAATRDGAAWRVDAPEPVGPLDSLFARLLQRAGGGGVMLGLDVPLGLPRAYAARLGWAADFPGFLRGLPARPGFFAVCDTLAEASLARPFYPRRGLPGMTRAGHAAALGLDDPAAMLRRCDRATATRPAAAALFWTLGANQVGRAAIVAWRDLLLPALRTSPERLRLWPFDGALPELAAPGRVVVAEVYPAEALRQLGLRLDGSKRRQADRARLAPSLLAPSLLAPSLLAPGLLTACAGAAVQPGAALRALLEQGCGADAAGEDRFDSVLGLLCMLRVLAGRQPEGPPPGDDALRRWEGWILGQPDGRQELLQDTSLLDLPAPAG